MVALHNLCCNFLFSRQMICKQYIILNHVFFWYKSNLEPLHYFDQIWQIWLKQALGTFGFSMVKYIYAFLHITEILLLSFLTFSWTLKIDKYNTSHYTSISLRHFYAMKYFNEKLSFWLCVLQEGVLSEAGLLQVEIYILGLVKNSITAYVTCYNKYKL